MHNKKVKASPDSTTSKKSTKATQKNTKSTGNVASTSNKM